MSTTHQRQKCTHGAVALAWMCSQVGCIGGSHSTRRRRATACSSGPVNEDDCVTSVHDADLVIPSHASARYVEYRSCRCSINLHSRQRPSASRRTRCPKIHGNGTLLPPSAARASSMTPTGGGEGRAHRDDAGKSGSRGLKARTFKKKLKARGRAWLDELQSMLWSIRTTATKPTGETPFFLVYGAEAVLPHEVRHRSAWVFAFDEAR